MKKFFKFKFKLQQIRVSLCLHFWIGSRKALFNECAGVYRLSRPRHSISNNPTKEV